MKVTKDFIKTNKLNAFYFIFSVLTAYVSLAIAAEEVSLFSFFKTNLKTTPLIEILVLLFIPIILAILFLEKKVYFKDLVKKLLLIYLPTEIVFIIAFYYSKEFHILIPLAVDAYILTASAMALMFYKKYSARISPQPAPEPKENYLSISQHLTKKNALPLLILAAIMTVWISFGFYHLGKSSAVDEPLWTFDRIPQFWNNISDGEFHKTMISDKPGITTAYVAGIGLNFVNPKEYKPARIAGYLINRKNDFEKFNLAFRVPIFIFSTIFILLFFFLIKKLWGLWTALMASCFIGLSPILLGISTIINPDSFLWIFMPLSILSYFIFLKDKIKNKKFLVLAGILVGLSFLTKYITNFLFIYLFAIIFIEHIFLTHKNNECECNKTLRKSLIDYLSLMLIAFTTVFLLLPAAWINPARILEITIFSDAFSSVWPYFFGILGIFCLETFFWKNILTKKVISFIATRKNLFYKALPAIFLFFIFFTIINTLSGMPWFDFESMMSSPKTSPGVTDYFGSFSANFYSLIFGISPIILAFMIFGSLEALLSKSFLKNNIFIYYLLFFILLYYLGSTVSMVSSTVRYQIAIFPLAFILSAVGAISLYERIKSVPLLRYALIIAIPISLISGLYSIKPFYLSYASSLLPNEYILNPKDMGDGSYEAAQYLNNLPGAKDLMIWTDKRGVCYSFIGKCSTDIEIKRELTFDYFVISSGRQNRIEKLSKTRGKRSAYPMQFEKLYTDNVKTVFSLEIDKRPSNYVKVISSQDISLN